MRATLTAGDRVIVQSPLYFPLHAIAREIGCQLEEWNASPANFHFEVERLASICDDTTKAIIINFPHNPTGTMITEDDLRGIAQLAEASNAILISDEVFRLMEYDPAHRLPAACEIYDRAVSIAGLSKVAGAGGLRIGWLASKDQSLLQSAQEFVYYTTSTMNTPCQVIALSVMKHLPQIIQGNRELIAANLQRLVEFVSAHSDTFSLVRPQAGTMAVVQQRTGISNLELCKEILEKSRLLVVPGEFVGLPDGFLRLGLGMSNFAEGLSRLERFLARSTESTDATTQCRDKGTRSMQSPNAISIVSYDARYKSEFKRLNEAWISGYFEMEATDHKVLDHPEQYIIDSGGEILFAVERDTVAGTCAVMKMDDGPFDFELVKMAVHPIFRGRGIGQQLGEAIIDRARIRGAKTIFLESNTILAPAISLYRKLGFVETERQPTPYARGNIHMVLEFDL